jgi:hypothetical protein
MISAPQEASHMFWNNPLIRSFIAKVHQWCRTLLPVRTDHARNFLEDHSDAPVIIGAFVLLLTAAGLPLFIVGTPALGDYLNHLARMHIIATLDKDPYLAQFYSVTWQIIPNLAMDLIVPLLSRYVDLYLAGKLFVFMTIALILTGGMAIHYTVFRRISLAPLASFLFIYNFALLLGLLNYLCGVGVALWGIAAWIGLHPRHPWVRAAVSLGFVLALFLSHLYAVGLYGLALLCFEVWRVFTGRSQGHQTLSDALVLALPFLLVFPLLMATPMMELSAVNLWKPWRLKWQALDWLFKLYHPTLGFTIAAFVSAVVVWGLWRRLLRLHPVGWTILCAGIVVYAVMPTASVFASFYTDYRLPIAIVFMVIPFSRWELTKPQTRWFTAVIIALALLRMTSVEVVWLDIDRVYAGLREAFQEVKPGGTILLSRTERVDFPFNRAGPLYYAACLATIERSAFAPNMLTRPGAPFLLSVQPAYRHLARDPKFQSPRISELISAANDPTIAHAQGFHWAEWHKHFDYLLVLYTHDKDTNPLPQTLSTLSTGYRFQLYRIKQPAEAPHIVDVTKRRLDKE